MNNASKITVPANVANAIAHYVALADSKHEAFQDILSLGYEAEKSELILRHFAHDFDELMEALICGYEVEGESPEAKIRKYYEGFTNSLVTDADWAIGIRTGVKTTLGFLGIKIEGVNA
jgi:DNA integrity scanning protein DisA with diadenylate cyclase activity